MLNGRPDIPKIVIISVSVIGTLLLLLNIIIVSYFIYKKKNTTKTKQDEGINLYIFFWFLFLKVGSFPIVLFMSIPSNLVSLVSFSHELYQMGMGTVVVVVVVVVVSHKIVIETKT